MLASWDTETGQRLRRHIGHEDVINSMDVSKRGEEMLVSACDDGYIGVRQKYTVQWERAEHDGRSGIRGRRKQPTSWKPRFQSQQ